MKWILLILLFIGCANQSELTNKNTSAALLVGTIRELEQKIEQCKNMSLIQAKIMRQHEAANKQEIERCKDVEGKYKHLSTMLFFQMCGNVNKQPCCIFRDIQTNELSVQCKHGKVIFTEILQDKKAGKKFPLNKSATK